MDNERKHEEEEKGKACVEYNGGYIPKLEFPDWQSIIDKAEMLICSVDLIKANSEGFINDEEFEKLSKMAKSSDEELRDLVKNIIKNKKNGNI